MQPEIPRSPKGRSQPIRVIAPVGDQRRGFGYGRQQRQRARMVIPMAALRNICVGRPLASVRTWSLEVRQPWCVRSVDVLPRGCGRPAGSQLSGEPSGRSRQASGCSRPVPHRPAPRAFARTALATQAMPSLVRAVGSGRIASSPAVAIDVDDAARHPSVIHARSAVGAGQGQTDHLCHSKPEQVAHERPLRCSVTLCMAAGWERFPWLPIVD